jgi:hypothetical protein
MVKVTELRAALLEGTVNKSADQATLLNAVWEIGNPNYFNLKAIENIMLANRLGPENSEACQELLTEAIMMLGFSKVRIKHAQEESKREPTKAASR